MFLWGWASIEISMGRWSLPKSSPLEIVCHVWLSLVIWMPCLRCLCCLFSCPDACARHYLNKLNLDDFEYFWALDQRCFSWVISYFAGLRLRSQVVRCGCRSWDAVACREMRVASREMRLQVVRCGLRVARCGLQVADANAGCRSRMRMRVAGRGMRMRVAVAGCECGLRVARCDLLLPNFEGMGNSLAYAYGVSMAYLCNSFVLSGIDFIFGMVLV